MKTVFVLEIAKGDWDDYRKYTVGMFSSIEKAKSQAEACLSRYKGEKEKFITEWEENRRPIRQKFTTVRHSSNMYDEGATYSITEWEIDKTLE